jgi:hypothetical protein
MRLVLQEWVVQFLLDNLANKDYPQANPCLLLGMAHSTLHHQYQQDHQSVHDFQLGWETKLVGHLTQLSVEWVLA